MDGLTKDDKHIDFVIEILNEAFEADPVAMNELFNIKVPVNDELLNHRTIQCSAQRKDFGVMGLINGIIGADDNRVGHIAMDVDLKSLDPYDAELLGFRRTPEGAVRGAVKDEGE